MPNWSPQALHLFHISSLAVQSLWNDVEIETPSRCQTPLPAASDESDERNAIVSLAKLGSNVVAKELAKLLTADVFEEGLR